VTRLCGLSGSVTFYFSLESCPLWRRLWAYFTIVIFLLFLLEPEGDLSQHFTLRTRQVSWSEMQLQLTMFMKNLSIFGGGLVLLAFGKGRKKVEAA